ncbi:MAG: hypothetical protein ABSA46_20520 [Thermodesulfovibrionales bacterium]
MRLATVFSVLSALTGCKKEVAPQARPATQVSVIKVELRDTPLVRHSFGKWAISARIDFYD